jgi:hypothetical protein
LMRRTGVSVNVSVVMFSPRNFEIRSRFQKLARSGDQTSTYGLGKKQVKTKTHPLAPGG